MIYKTGIVSVVGRPNAGKSSLINRLVGQKVSIVSPKPQTTRNNILGVLNKESHQIVFVDTPGIHESHTGLDKHMMKGVRAASEDCDVLLCVLDGSKPINQKINEMITNFASKTIPVLVVISKIDITSFDKLYPEIAQLQKIEQIKGIIPYSSVSGQNVDVIEQALLDLLEPSSPENAMFPTDEYTDKSVSFMCGEIIREKALIYLEKEIPHGIAIEITVFKEKSKQAEVQANIICEKNSHKNIIIGKHGSKIKQIGTHARKDIEQLLNKKVLLLLYVKIKADWRNNPNAIAELFKFEV